MRFAKQKTELKKAKKLLAYTYKAVKRDWNKSSSYMETSSLAFSISQIFYAKSRLECRSRKNEALEIYFDSRKRAGAFDTSLFDRRGISSYFAPLSVSGSLRP